MLSNYPGIRQTVYLVYGILTLLLGAYGAALSATGTGAPDWYVGTLAALAFIGTGLGFTAASNVSAVSGGAAPVVADEPRDTWLDDEAAA